MVVALRGGCGSPGSAVVVVVIEVHRVFTQEVYSVIEASMSRRMLDMVSHCLGEGAFELVGEVKEGQVMFGSEALGIPQGFAYV